MAQYQIGSAVFGSWTIRRKLGEGSFGRVYEINREDFGEVYRAALKVITVPSSDAELQSALGEGMTIAEARTYFYGVVEDIVREFAIMAKLKGTANVVGYEDHAVIQHEDGIGWDILIRMELLNPLLPYAYAHPFARRDIIRLGIDICRALELCQKYNVIHRDIKPENIFVSDNGDFKLGDFGIARTIDRTMSGLSKKGTYNYMAPEVYRGGDYGFSVDLYSLGIVLYRLLNKNRVPFLPAPPAPITFQSRESALARRMSGEEFPNPIYAEGRLAEIIRKACAFDPKQRYSSPAQMRQELEAILYDTQDAALIYPDGDELQLMENQYASKTPTGTAAAAPDPTAGENRTQSMFGGTATDGFDASRTESVFSGSVFAGEGTSRTESMFGHTAPGSFDASRTESMFGSTPPGGFDASRTESMFGHSVPETPKKASTPPPKPAASAAKPAAKPKAKGRRTKIILLAVLAAALVVFGAAGVSSVMRIKAQDEYLAAMQEGERLLTEDPARAIHYFERAIDTKPKEVEPKISLAYAMYMAGEYDSCITYIEDDLAMGKSYDLDVQSKLSEILGAAYFEQDDYAAAASFFRLSTAGGDITVPAMRDYAVSLGKLKDFEAADEVLQRMFTAGASDDVTHYVQAEVAYAQEDYLAAEEGFSYVLDVTSDVTLQKRALRSLAEVYRDCSALEPLGQSPVNQPAEQEIRLLEEGIARYSLENDTTLLEMLALAYYRAAHTEPLNEDYLRQAEFYFGTVLSLGVQKDYIYRNLYTIYYELGLYEDAGYVLEDYAAIFPDDYMPHALRGMLYITMENEKPQENRDYSKAAEAYELAGSMIRSDDDATYFQQLESLIDQLKEHGWL